MSGQKKILIVDDTPTSVKTLARILKETYKVVVSTSGEKALELIDKGNVPDLILCDVIMPSMDGYEFCKKIKSKNETKEIPFIFVTGKENDSDKQKGLDLGAIDYIKKPFDANQVLNSVKENI